ncbi:glycoside hydrolase family 73 protein [Lactiplantibacillus daowaiensis]|uniref:Glycoside hydrolase family 73 protein n=1 Tax=Lactiplantibacillus daowaiensis TaxID=2559918 RepID=A0ABW1RX20_9LACO|nr:glycoside hydrolase family 73 protein [Lactiplantibacillus daowaiensis]
MAAKKRRRKRRTKSGRLFVKNGRLQWLNILIVFVLVGGLGWVVSTRWTGWVPKQTETPVKTHAGFIKRLVPDAQAMQTKYHVLASITLSQAILESDWGQSTNATENNNLFGVKATEAEPGKMMPTQEYYDGAYHNVKRRFRVYSSWHASMVAHAKRLANGPAWSPNHYQAVIKATNYRTAAQALAKAGYATDPDYAQKLINVIQKYDLERYDKK